jgi:hypothetical protein
MQPSSKMSQNEPFLILKRVRPGMCGTPTRGGNVHKGELCTRDHLLAVVHNPGLYARRIQMCLRAGRRIASGRSPAPCSAGQPFGNSSISILIPASQLERTHIRFVMSSYEVSEVIHFADSSYRLIRTIKSGLKKRTQPFRCVRSDGCVQTCISFPS